MCTSCPGIYAPIIKVNMVLLFFKSVKPQLNFSGSYIFETSKFVLNMGTVNALKFSTPKCLTKLYMQTVLTQIRMLLKEHSDQGLHCLSFLKEQSDQGLHCLPFH